MTSRRSSRGPSTGSSHGRLSAASGTSPRRPDRKTLQLCRQVQRTLGYVLGSCNDNVVSELFVESVEPAPNASHLLVTVVPAGELLDATTVLGHLHHASGYLRSEIATSINRRKAPELSFRYTIPTVPDLSTVSNSSTVPEPLDAEPLESESLGTDESDVHLDNESIGNDEDKSANG